MRSAVHDVTEDTSVSYDELAAQFPKEVMDALVLLTHKKGTDYFEYVRAIKANPYAKAVKLADIAHNADQSRMAGCDNISISSFLIGKQNTKKPKKY